MTSGAMARWGLPALGLVTVAALLIRLVRLDPGVLSSHEGVRAMAAWQLAQGRAPDWWEAPSLIVMTAAGFVALSDTETAARLLPAFAGAGCIAALALFRGWFGWWPVLVAGVLLALSPSGLLLSRSVAEDAPAALATLLLGWALVRYRDGGLPVWAALGLGVPLHLGFAGVTGVIALLLFVVVWTTLLPKAAGRPAWLGDGQRLLFLLVAVFVLVGTGFLLHPAGFGFPSLTAWARHLEPAMGTGSHSWLAMLGYEAPALLLGLPAAAIALWRWPRDPVDPSATVAGFFAIWGVLGLGLLLLEGQGSPPSVFAAALPLTVLAGKLMGDHLGQVEHETWLRFLGGLPAVAACLVFAGLNLLKVPDAGTGSAWLAAAGCVVAIGFLAVLARSAPQPASLLTLMGLAGVFVLQVHGDAKLAAPWLGTFSGHDLLTGRVRETVHLVPYTVSGQAFTASVQADLRPLLAWHLRGIPGVAYTPQVGRGPQLVIGELPAGTDFGNYSRRDLPAFEGWTPVDWGPQDAVRWLAAATVPGRSWVTPRVSMLVQVRI